MQGVGEAGNGVPVPCVMPGSSSCHPPPRIAFQISVVLQARQAKQRHCSSWGISCYEAHSWERVVFKIC